MAEWDDENFEPLAALVANKWEGEDEDDDVKESWEDEEEERNKLEEQAKDETAKPKSKKKSIQEKIAEKERLKVEEYEKRSKELQEEDNISPEEKLRRQKESDLKAALETTFGGNSNSIGDANKDDFQEITDELTKKIQVLSKNEDYPEFAENLVRTVCATLNSFDLKKIKTTIDNLYLEKQKIEKGDKAKKSKGKGKAKLKMEGDNLQLNQYSAYVEDYNEYDDFM